MFIARALVFALALGATLSAVAADCANVVNATAEEMKAGSTSWSDSQAGIVRSAAGAACVKTASGRYEQTGDASTCSAVVDDTLNEMRAGAVDWQANQTGLARSAAASACIKTASGRYAATRSDNAAEPTPMNAQDVDDDEGGFRIGGVKIRPLTGPPSEKPYARD